LNSADFKSSIRQSLAFFEEANLDELTTNLSSLDVNPAFNEIALKPTAKYEDIYKAALSFRQFNIQLKDFSLFQFSWINGAEWRLAYYPNPWFTGVPGANEKLNELRELLEAGAITTEEFLDLVSDDFEYYQSVPMFRFEYSERQYKAVVHPASHFHIGTQGLDRWAWRRKLSPLSFSMMMVRMYYPDVWLKRSSFHDETVVDCWEHRLNEVLAADGVSLEFNNVEARCVHLGAIA
jgi:hypothetical protein